MAQPNLPAVTAIVVAAGASRRMGFDKLSYRLPDGRTVLETSCAALAAHPAITQLVLVCGGNRAACETIAAACPKPCAVVQGGATRADSVRNGLAAATGELVAIHDAARPFVSESVITAALTAAAETGAAAPAVPVKDTVKVADPSGRVLDTPDRATLYAVQTPQCFRRALYTRALAAVTGEKARLVTDDCSLFELAGLPVRLTEGDYANYKITTKEDLQKEKTMRIGHGYDVHRLVEDRKLILGGVEIPMMVNQGYDVPFSVAITAASSCLGPIIPPSVPMIMAATMTGLSVSKMFMAGIIPGLLLGFGMCATCYILSVKRHYPKRDKHASLAHVLHATKEAIWALIMVAIILFGIMGGIVTPTEASIICVVYGLFVSVFIYRKMGPKEMYSCLKDTVSSASAIMALVAFANVFAFILTKEHIPSMIADAMLRLTSNKYLILLLINLFLIFVGMFMETIAAILILFPTLLAVATAVGVDPIHFGIIVVMNLVLGLCTPPVGVCLFAATNIGARYGKCTLSDSVKALVPLLIVNFGVLFLVTYVPFLTVGVANLVMG